MKKYCDFVIENIIVIDNLHKHKLLPLVRDYMDELKKYSDESYNIIDNNIDIANKEMLKNLHCFTYSLLEDSSKEINDFQKKQYEKLKNLSNIDKIDHLLANLLPFNIEQIKNNINNSKSNLDKIFPPLYLDENGKAINYKELNQTEMFSLKTKQHIDIFIDLQFQLLIDSFF